VLAYSNDRSGCASESRRWAGLTEWSVEGDDAVNMQHSAAETNKPPRSQTFEALDFDASISIVSVVGMTIAGEVNQSWTSVGSLYRSRNLQKMLCNLCQ
jgi:hypothetical protein